MHAAANATHIPVGLRSVFGRSTMRGYGTVFRPERCARKSARPTLPSDDIRLMDASALVSMGQDDFQPRVAFVEFDILEQA